MVILSWFPAAKLIPPVNKFASGLAPDPQRWISIIIGARFLKQLSLLRRVI